MGCVLQFSCIALAIFDVFALDPTCGLGSFAFSSNSSFILSLNELSPRVFDLETASMLHDVHVGDVKTILKISNA